MYGVPQFHIAAPTRQLGVSRSWASRDANAASVRNLAVNRVLVDVGPDHYAQLEAVDMFTRIMNYASVSRRQL